MVKANVEPFIYRGMYSVVLIADFLWRDAIFNGFGFDCGAVFVGAADIQCVEVTHFAVPGENICAENRADDIA
jgi:hypothetical protein